MPSSRQKRKRALSATRNVAAKTETIFTDLPDEIVDLIFQFCLYSSNELTLQLLLLKLVNKHSLQIVNSLAGEEFFKNYLRFNYGLEFDAQLAARFLVHYYLLNQPQSLTAKGFCQLLSAEQLDFIANQMAAYQRLCGVLSSAAGQEPDRLRKLFTKACLRGCVISLQELLNHFANLYGPKPDHTFLQVMRIPDVHIAEITIKVKAMVEMQPVNRLKLFAQLQAIAFLFSHCCEGRLYPANTVSLSEACIRFQCEDTDPRKLSVVSGLLSCISPGGLIVVSKKLNSEQLDYLVSAIALENQRRASYHFASLTEELLLCCATYEFRSFDFLRRIAAIESFALEQLPEKVLLNSLKYFINNPYCRSRSQLRLVNFLWQQCGNILGSVEWLLRTDRDTQAGFKNYQAFLDALDITGLDRLLEVLRRHTRRFNSDRLDAAGNSLFHFLAMLRGSTLYKQVACRPEDVDGRTSQNALGETPKMVAMRNKNFACMLYYYQISPVTDCEHSPLVVMASANDVPLILQLAESEEVRQMSVGDIQNGLTAMGYYRGCLNGFLAQLQRSNNTALISALGFLEGRNLSQPFPAQIATKLMAEFLTRRGIYAVAMRAPTRAPDGDLPPVMMRYDMNKKF